MVLHWHTCQIFVWCIFLLESKIDWNRELIFWIRYALLHIVWLRKICIWKLNCVILINLLFVFGSVLPLIPAPECHFSVVLFSTFFWYRKFHYLHLFGWYKWQHFEEKTLYTYMVFFFPQKFKNSFLMTFWWLVLDESFCKCIVSWI